jgi:Peptidase A4 family
MRPRWYVPVATLALAGGSMLAFVGTAAASSAAIRSGHVSVAIGSGHVRLVPRSPHMRVLSGGRARTIRPFAFARGGRNAVTSSNWSGYAAHNGPYKSISASWVEPRGHCSGSGHKYSSFWVGLDGFNSSSVEQTGSSLNCKSGHPRYSAWYEMFPKLPVTFHNAVRPGDHFHGSVTYNGGGRFTLKLSDTTRHWTHTEHKSLKSARRASAEVIVEAPSSSSRGVVLPLADFGTVHISGAKVNGSKMGSHHPTKIIMQSGRRRKDTVSGLANGQSFSATWRHS